MENKNKFLVALIGLLSLVMVNLSQAQTKTGYTNIWFHYSGKNMLTKKLSFTFEATMRYANGLSEKQQYFVRPSIDYQFTKSFMGSVGYSHYLTYVYGNPALNKIPIPENHYWIQGLYSHQSGKIKFIHRLRNEFRYVGIATKNSSTQDFEITSYDFRDRFRYMFLVNYPLLKKDDAVKINSFIGNEMFLNIGKEAGTTLFQQNRIIAGIGYNINKHNQIQLTYIHQNIWNFANTIQESNPTIRIGYITNFDFYNHD